MLSFYDDDRREHPGLPDYVKLALAADSCSVIGGSASRSMDSLSLELIHSAKEASLACSGSVSDVRLQVEGLAVDCFSLRSPSPAYRKWRICLLVHEPDVRLCISDRRERLYLFQWTDLSNNSDITLSRGNKYILTFRFHATEAAYFSFMNPPSLASLIPEEKAAAARRPVPPRLPFFEPLPPAALRAAAPPPAAARPPPPSSFRDHLARLDAMRAVAPVLALVPAVPEKKKRKRAESKPRPKLEPLGEAPPDSEIQLPDDASKAGASLKCPLCLGLLYKPLSLACGHSLCSLCYYKAKAHATKDNPLQCPSRCKLPAGHKPLASFVLDDVIRQFVAQQPKATRDARAAEEKWTDRAIEHAQRDSRKSKKPKAAAAAQ